MAVAIVCVGLRLAWDRGWLIGRMGRAGAGVGLRLGRLVGFDLDLPRGRLGLQMYVQKGSLLSAFGLIGFGGGKIGTN